MTDQLLQFYNAHNIVILAVLWFTLSAVINLLTRYKSPADWVKLGEKNPKLQNAIRLSRALGIDPIKAIDAIKDILFKQAEKTKQYRPKTLKNIPNTKK